MSTDWFLFSPSHKKMAMVGSIGMRGVKVWPTEYMGNEFLRWAIDNHVTDVVLIDENDQRLDDVAFEAADIGNDFTKQKGKTE